MNWKEFKKLSIGNNIRIKSDILTDEYGYSIKPIMYEYGYPVLEISKPEGEILIRNSRGVPFMFDYRDVELELSWNDWPIVYCKKRNNLPKYDCAGPITKLKEAAINYQRMKKSYDEIMKHSKLKPVEVEQNKVKVGDKVIITKNICGHKFEIGEEVEILMDKFSLNKTYIVSRFGKGSLDPKAWCQSISGDEFKIKDSVVEKDKEEPTYSFFLDKHQEKKLDTWMKKQKKVNYGAIGGGLKFTFEPTGLGDIVTVAYNGKKLDLSDVENW